MLGPRYAYNAQLAIQHCSADTLRNANLTWNPKPFTVMLGGYDLLNRKTWILPGYSSGVEGLAGQGLEGFLKVKYAFSC